MQIQMASQILLNLLFLRDAKRLRLSCEVPVVAEVATIVALVVVLEASVAVGLLLPQPYL